MGREAEEITAIVVFVSQAEAQEALGTVDKKVAIVTSDRENLSEGVIAISLNVDFIHGVANGI